MPTIIKKAIHILKAGGLVAFPTETVYGLGADARNESAVERIFKAKERPFENPLIVHIESVDALNDWAINIPEAAYQLATAFWPGPLTMILPRHPSVSRKVTGGQETVGLRIPKHPIALELLSQFGGGIAAPSANRYTRISATTMQAVDEELGQKVDLVIDGGPCAVGVESTILDMTSVEPTILRPGMISAAMIAAVLNCEVQNHSKSKIRAPGMARVHYAPRNKLHILPKAELMAFAAVAKEKVVIISHSETSGMNVPVIRLSDQPDLYAHHIYHTLREADKQDDVCILVESLPDSPDWVSIQDRLTRAAEKTG